MIRCTTKRCSRPRKAGRARCERCLVQAAAAAKRRRGYWRDLGLCIDCGGDRAAGSPKWCHRCVAVHRRANRKYIAEPLPLRDGDVVLLDVKTTHSARQTSPERFNFTFRRLAAGFDEDAATPRTSNLFDC